MNHLNIDGIFVDLDWERCWEGIHNTLLYVICYIMVLYSNIIEGCSKFDDGSLEAIMPNAGLHKTHGKTIGDSLICRPIIEALS